MKYIVQKVAVQNPAIIGRVLYLTHTGCFSLTRAAALRFKTKRAAEIEVTKYPGSIVRRVLK